MTAQVDRSPEGGDAQRLHAKHESAVPQGMRPKSYRDSSAYLRSDRVVFGEKVWPLKFSRQEKAS